jgi:hypothetical protein
MRIPHAHSVTQTHLHPRVGSMPHVCHLPCPKPHAFLCTIGSMPGSCIMLTTLLTLTHTSHRWSARHTESSHLPPSSSKGSSARTSNETTTTQPSRLSLQGRTPSTTATPTLTSRSPSISFMTRVSVLERRCLLDEGNGC